DVGVADLLAARAGRGDHPGAGRDRVADMAAADLGVLRGGRRGAEREHTEHDERKPDRRHDDPPLYRARAMTAGPVREKIPSVVSTRKRADAGMASTGRVVAALALR